MKGKKILFLAFAIVLGISSCQKEEEFTTKTNNGEEKIMSVDPIEANILNFIERMDAVREDPEIEDALEWNYSQDSAVWYLEATINYEFSCNYNRDFSDDIYFALDFDTISNEIAGGIDDIYNITDLVQTHDDVFLSIGALFEEYDYEEKIFICADLYIDENSEITSRYSFGNIIESYSIGNWYWGWALGMCNGTNQGKDATDILEQYENCVDPQVLNIWSPNSYYTSIQSTQWIYPYSVSTSNNPYGNFKLFHDYQEVTLNHHCLSTGELSAYIAFLGEIALSNLPYNKETLFFNVMDETMFGITQFGDDFWEMIHITKITYGVHSSTSNANTYTY
jgi:hypothetical protein